MYVGVLVPASVALPIALVPGHGEGCRGHVPGPARSRHGSRVSWAYAAYHEHLENIDR